MKKGGTAPQGSQIVRIFPGNFAHGNETGVAVRDGLFGKRYLGIIWEMAPATGEIGEIVKNREMADTRGKSVNPGEWGNRQIVKNRGMAGERRMWRRMPFRE